jgi:hypothetical protein
MPTFLTLPKTRLSRFLRRISLADFPPIYFTTAIAPSHYALNGVVRAGLASSVLLQLLVIPSCLFTPLRRWAGFDSLGKNHSIIRVSLAYCAGFVYIGRITYNWAGYRPGFITFNLFITRFCDLYSFVLATENGPWPTLLGTSICSQHKGKLIKI